MTVFARRSRSLVVAMALIAVAVTAHAESGKPVEVRTIGPPVALGDAQRAAIEAKHRAVVDPGAPVVAKAAPASPPAAAPAPLSPEHRAALEAKITRWPTISPRLGPVPRSDWPAPWAPRKLADVTVSRPIAPGTSQ